jgi:hypothetical protein
MIRLLAALSVAVALCAQASSRAPVSDNPVVDLEGRIGKVQIAPGAGMPALELETKNRTARVLLGPMRFLIDNDFNPKAGEQARIKAYETEEGFIAIEVTLVREKRTLKFRDANGWPVWRGGGRRHRGPR